MLITQHRSLSAVNIALVALVGLILCLGVYLHLPETMTITLFEPTIDGLLSLNLDETISPQMNVIVTLVLTLFQAFQLNRIINFYNLLGKPSFLTALMFMTLVSTFLPFLVLSPTLICNFISIWMLGKLFKIYKMHDVKGRMFDLGVIVALGSLVYFPFTVMLILLWLSLLIFRPFHWREWLTPLLGFASIYLLLGVAFYWTRRIDLFYALFEPFTYNFSGTIAVSLNDYFVLVPILIALIAFVLVLKDHYYKSFVHVRKSFRLLFYMLILVAISFYMNDGININHFLLCVPPLSIYLAYYFAHAKTKWVYESIYALIVIGIIASQYL